MRLFIAIDLAPDTRAAVAALATHLKQETGFRQATIKWVEASHLHITLRFLGLVGARVRAAVERSLEEVFHQPRFDMSLTEVGVFPPRGAPRVLWLGVERGSAELRSLQRELSVRLDGCGFPSDQRAFVPHLTIGRVKTATRDQATRIRAALADVTVDIPTSRVERVVLYESQLSARGARYHPRGGTDLRAG